MEMKIKTSYKLAECVGLWLAEGYKKSKYEITFTNNCIPLVELFADTIQKQFKNYSIKPRVYVYSANDEKINISFDCNLKYYTDIRANKPYLIYRVGSAKVLKEWLKIVTKIKNEEEFYHDILRGFFAGEGNVKEGAHSNKTLRIAQGKQDEFIEKILKYFDITYRYYPNGRAYNITGIWNWKKFAKLKIPDLHPDKKKKFYSVFNSYKEEHYPDDYIKGKIDKILKKPHTSLDLSKRFKRSQARIQDILIPLKKENKVKVFHIQSKSYWINTNQNKIIISKIKEKYMKSLKNKEKTVTELSKEMSVCWKSSFRRLLELQKLNLVEKDTHGTWSIIDSDKEVVVL